MKKWRSELETGNCDLRSQHFENRQALSFQLFKQSNSSILNDPRCMIEPTKGGLCSCNLSGRSLTTEYLVQESLVTCGVGQEIRRRISWITKRPHDIALFAVEWRNPGLNGDNPTQTTQDNPTPPGDPNSNARPVSATTKARGTGLV